MRCGRHSVYLLFGLTLIVLSGCTSIGYYAQAVSGHLELRARERPIDQMLNDPSTAPVLAKRLAAVLAMREFAVRELDLPDGGSYRRYADLERDFVVYSVVAAPQFSMTPVPSCFLVIGCVSYRGYYRVRDAAAHARTLRRQGLDVYVAPVPAYSTLGWFDDPVPSTLLRGPDWSVAGTLFHELAHQRMYVANDTGFNEAYAVAVQRSGVKRWLQVAGDDAARRQHADAEARREQFLTLVRWAREQLVALYRQAISVQQMQAHKDQTVRELRARYAALRNQWQGFTGYDRWFSQDVNNAKLALVGEYNTLVPDFERLLVHVDNNWPRFHALVSCIAKQSVAKRRELLRTIVTPPTTQRGSSPVTLPCSSSAG